MVAKVIDSDFAEYYHHFMPLMSQILENVDQSTMGNKTLRAKAIETVGEIFASITDSDKNDSFKDSVKTVTGVLVDMLKGGLPDDDPQDIAIKDTLVSCAGFLGTEFAAYMPTLLQTIVTDANLSLDFKMESADMPVTDKNVGMTIKMPEIRGMGEQRVSMNTDNLQKKVGAFVLLN